jgi:hypothetical protein
MKLGLAGHREDPRGRTLKLRDFLKLDFAVPAACDLDVDAHLPRETDALGNLDVGCCGPAAAAKFARWEDRIRGVEPSVTEADVLREYAALSGWTPDDPTSDVGIYALDMFRKWRTDGLFGRRIGAFAQVDFFDDDERNFATFCLGGVLLCMNIPNVAMESDTWDGRQPDGGPAGGHMVRQNGTHTVQSWKWTPYCNSAFVHRYAFDAYAVFSEESIKGDGRSFSGLDLGGLREALAAVTA